MQVWNKLEEVRRSVEGDPFWGALLGGGIGLIIEAGRLVSAQAEGAGDKLKALEQSVAAAVKKADAASVNPHRQSGKKPSVTGVATTITSGGSSVSEITGITNTDQAGKYRIGTSSVASPAATTLFRVNFATKYAEAPAVFVKQQAGADVGLKVANVTDAGFDVVTGAGITTNTVQELAYFVVPLSLKEHLS